jgi:hypothetical protein
VLTVEKRSKGNNLVLKDLHDTMCQLWRTLYRDDTEADSVGIPYKSAQPSNTKVEEGKFLGRVPDLKTVVNGGPAVYTKGPNRGDEFTRTTKEIGLYIGRTYQNGGILQREITTLKTLVIPLPELPEGATDATVLSIHNERIKLWVRKDADLKEQLSTLSILIQNQCG